jgi:hypothetical protein
MKNLFIDAKGRDHRTPSKIDLEKVKLFFEHQGFIVHKLHQEWRNVYGKLEKNQKNMFLKLASTPDIGHRTKNEAGFNKQIKPLVKGVWTVPEFYSEGQYGDLYYFLSEYFDYPLLLERKVVPDKNLIEKLPEVVEINNFLIAQKNLPMVRDDEFESITIKERIKRYHVKWQEFYEGVEEFDLKNIREELKNIEQTFEPALNHCDFVPWHIMDGKPLVLFDAEHASNFNPKYYDVAYFFHRLYTMSKGQEAAKIYINIFRNNLGDKKNNFDVAIRPILAARIIGGFWDAKRDGQTDFSLHEQIREEFLSNNLY